MVNLKEEFDRRKALLSASGLDISGFGMINVFNLYDHIVEHFGFFAKKLHHYGFNRMAFSITGVSTFQYKVRGCEIRQTIYIKSEGREYSQDCWIHDQDPDEARKYVKNEYNLA